MRSGSSRIPPSLAASSRRCSSLACYHRSGTTPSRAPVCLFLDEPTSSLDIHYQLALLEIVRAFRERRCTIIAILHDLNVASRYGDAFFLLERGRLVLETDSADAIPLALIERVFQVRAERVPGTATAEATWQFRL